MLLLYLHGFNSSPQSHKAMATGAWLSEHHPEQAFLCPFLSPYPEQAIVTLEEISGQHRSETALVMGSSMGGFYATWLAQQWGCKAVLINPAVRPWQGREYLLGAQKNFHTGEEYLFEQHHIDSFSRWEVDTLARPDNFWVLLQTGDEVLDYTRAEEKYKDCRVTIESGGDHSFQGYERFLPEIYNFWQQ